LHLFRPGTQNGRHPYSAAIPASGGGVGPHWDGLARQLLESVREHIESNQALAMQG
jgi:hypothetical protein